MDKNKLKLSADEKVLLEEENITGTLPEKGNFTGDLVLTDKSFYVLVHGVFGVKSVECIELYQISQCNIEDEQLVIYLDESVYTFRLLLGAEDLPVWQLAVCERFCPDTEAHGYDYYQALKQEYFNADLYPDPSEEETGAADKLIAELGLSSFQDDLKSFGNKFRSALNLDLYDTKKMKRERKRRAVIAGKIAYARKNRGTEEPTREEKFNAIEKQLEAVAMLKKLLDQGAITQEEFDLKKKEILKI
jgi:hypothetical protein